MILEITGHDMVAYMDEITHVFSNNVLNILENVDFQNYIK